MFKQFKKRRETLQKYTSIFLPLVVIGGWFYPPLGYFLLLCMFGALGLALFNGRSWCDWMCPRGSFYDIVVNRFSRNVIIPSVLKAMWFRIIVLIGLLAALSIQVYWAWGDSRAVGLAFVRVLTITTTAGIVLGALFQQRAWCHICPMGTVGNWLSRGKKPLYADEKCRDCMLCAKVCPMQLKPYEKKSGLMDEGDCIKCSSCIAACPINALGFDEQQKKAA
jgi:polyferredoxin